MRERERRNRRKRGKRGGEIKIWNLVCGPTWTHFKSLEHPYIRSCFTRCSPRGPTTVQQRRTRVLKKSSDSYSGRNQDTLKATTPIGQLLPPCNFIKGSRARGLPYKSQKPSTFLHLRTQNIFQTKND